MPMSRTAFIFEKAGFIAAALAVAFVFAASVNYNWLMTSDDAFISMRYAERFAEGRGLTWNDDMRVEGYSNPLWVLVLAGAKIGGIEPPDAAKLFGILFGAGALFMLYLLSAAATGKWMTPLNLVAPIILAVSSDFNYWMGSGLETPLFAFLSAAALYLFIKEREKPESTPFSALLFFLAAITRPEGIVLFAAAVLYIVAAKARYAFRGEKGSVSRREMFWFLLFVILLIGFISFRLAYYGKLFPNPFYAKMGGESDLSRGASYAGYFLLEKAPLLIIAPLALLVAGRGIKIVLAGWAMILAYAAAIVVMGGDWMNHWRLWCNVMPLFALVVALGFFGIVKMLLPEAGNRIAKGISVGFFSAAFIAGVFYFFGPDGRSALEAASFNQIPAAYAQEADYVGGAGREVGEFLRANAPANSVIAVNHAGAIPYYSKLRTIDMTGLNDPHISTIPGKGLHQKYDAGYILAERPDYIIFNTHARVGNGRITPNYWEGETAVYEHPLFKKNYKMLDNVWQVNWPPPKLHFVVIYKRTEE